MSKAAASGKSGKGKAAQNPEPTTETPNSPNPRPTERPEKLVDARPSRPDHRARHFDRLQKMMRTGQPPRPIGVDYKAVNAYQTPNYKFIIDRITQIPGELFAKLISIEKFQPKAIKYVMRPSRVMFRQPYRERPSHQYLPASTQAPPSTTKAPIVVEAIGNSEVDSLNIPNNTGGNLLILEPTARAVVEGDGTAIASPIARALIRRGSINTILFRPNSVAIAGPGGTAHATADLVIDYIDE